jgi:quercetin dioxygenase-like cupin family protein
LKLHFASYLAKVHSRDKDRVRLPVTVIGLAHEADLGKPNKGGKAKRRRFAGFASCAICAATGFIATDASAQGTAPATAGGLTRKTLSQTDGPMPGYVTINMFVEIEPNAFIRHTHPGIESSYVLEGDLDLPIQGQPTRSLKAGDGFQVPPETPHAGVKNGNKKTRLAITYVVEKGKPLVTPVPG